MWQEAVGPLQTAIWLHPGFSSPYILLGKVYHRLGRLELAEGLLNRAVSMDPNNAPARYLLGCVYRGLGRADEARKQFESYRKLTGSPDWP